MPRVPSRRILHEVLSLPTAPFAEHEVIAYVKSFLSKRPGLTCRRDPAGNLLIHLKRGGRKIKRPVCVTAHMDHPGFISDRMTGRTRLRAFWRGGVPVKYFVGSRVRFHVDDAWIKGTIRSVKTRTDRGRARVETAAIEMDAPVPPGAAGMWDFPDPRERGGRIHARGCDDLACTAAILAALDRLSRGRSTGEGYFLLTRAEEVGFVGAIAACRNRTIPSKCFVVNLETSSRRAAGTQGDGPILRVGDKTSVFTPPVTAHCQAVADALAKSKRSFAYQRKLMDGGTCEASAFAHLGYEATGICLALGNYHNVADSGKKLSPEHIHLRDYDCLVDWIEGLVTAKTPYTGRQESLTRLIDGLEREYSSLLADTVTQPG